MRLKKALSVFLTLAVFAGIFALPAAAVSVTDGNGFTIDTSTGLITGYCGPGGAITIPVTVGSTTVKGIGSFAFYHNVNITSVTFADGSVATDIGSQAFDSCSSLESVTFFPTSQLNSIGYEAFKNCSSLTGILIPSGVKSIGDEAFLKCTNLANVNFAPDIQLTSIGNDAFSATGLTRIIIPSGVKSIGNEAFLNCTSLATVYFDSVSGLTIGEEAFGNCTSLPSTLAIPSGVTSIGASAYSGCSSITNVIIPAGLTSIDGHAFSSCFRLASITVDDNNAAYKSEGGILFTKDGKTLVRYPAAIGSSTYAVPSNVTAIGADAFDSCESLTAITIPTGVKSIGDFAFYGCTALSAVTIPSDMTSIANGTFESCESLTGITIPAGVTSIGDSAFGGCSALASVTIPSGVTSIGEYAFYYCDNLNTVIFSPGSKLTSIGYGAFEYDPSLSGITIPSGVTSIGDVTFNLCTDLASAVIPDSVTAIGYSVFDRCSESLKIYCSSSSYARTYARDNNIPYADVPLAFISVASVPAKTSFIIGESLDLSGGKITVTYADSETKTISLPDPAVTVSGYDRSKIGTQTVTVTYGGKTAEFTVTVLHDMSVASLSIASVPSKTSYIVGESLNLSGGKIMVTYGDSETKTISLPDPAATVSGYDSSKIGTQTVTVTYGGKTAEFTVNVLHDTSVASVSIASMPSKTSFIVGESLDLSGGKITVTYGDSETKAISLPDPAVTVSGHDRSKTGTQTVTVTYGGKTAEFTVNVLPKVITAGGEEPSANPDTGDKGGMVLPIEIAAAFAALVAGIGIFRRKHHCEQD